MNRKATGHTWADAGVSYQQEGFGLDSGKVAKTFLLALILFGLPTSASICSNKIFIVDFRFLFLLQAI